MSERIAEPHTSLNALSEVAARAALTRCCGATRWVEAMLNQRPFASRAELFSAAEGSWQGLAEADYLEAFSHHPKIGANLDELARKFPTTAQLSATEQAGVTEASETTLQALSALNLAYEQRFGFIFIVCASGKTALEMRRLLEQRLPNSRPVELALAAAEQAKITRLRLEQLAR